MKTVNGVNENDARLLQVLDTAEASLSIRFPKSWVAFGLDFIIILGPNVKIDFIRSRQWVFL
ncbi:hypothetical protein EAX61_05205 [Dokdonia sinensis]|uniref:Uncharacterized protein n=1 Tax=Dokdonia sinensis TaxID=2479847 RepID=A0A3M0GH21_9FLAO|nr:hypothetical protein [Dokdonia sinensis]RMB60883.1 hypothetical protein EAX61_05205 [Dokdonia sinensis]